MGKIGARGGPREIAACPRKLRVILRISRTAASVRSQLGDGDDDRPLVPARCGRRCGCDCGADWRQAETHGEAFACRGLTARGRLRMMLRTDFPPFVAPRSSGKARPVPDLPCRSRFSRRRLAAQKQFMQKGIGVGNIFGCPRRLDQSANALSRYSTSVQSRLSG